MIARTSSPTVSEGPAAHGASPVDLALVVGSRARMAWLMGALLVGIVAAGFWNYHVVDGIGRDVIAGGTIGDTSALAGAFATRGAAFGFLFAAVAGLAATFTACNCVVFSMLPGLACSTDAAQGRRAAVRALLAFVLGVCAICLPYGAFIGFLGGEGIAAFNERAVRLARAQAIFSTLGLVMLAWGLVELGFFGGLRRRLPVETRRVLGAPSSRGLAMGLLVGLFAIGRPFPVMADFMQYAAESGNPLYGAAVMGVQGLGQVAVMVVLFALLVGIFGRRLAQWTVRAPHQAQILGAVALLAGGAFFFYYWGLAFAFDIGRWGFRLGWYG